MQLWPLTAPGSFATRDVIRREGVVISAATLRGPVEAPEHRHPDHDQLIYVAHGSCELLTADGRRTAMHEHDTMIVPAGVFHGFSTTTGTCQLLTVCLGQDGSLERLRRQFIQGWIHEQLIYIRGPGIRLAFELPIAPTDQYGAREETLIVHDIDYIHPSVKTQPIPALDPPTRSLRERIFGRKKRVKVLAATYSRPNGLPSAP